MKPPKGARLNYTHPLAGNLAGLWVFNEGSGTTVENLVSLGQGTGQIKGTVLPVWPQDAHDYNGGGAPGLVHDPMGGDLQFAGSQNTATTYCYVDCGKPAGALQDLGLNAFSVFARAVRYNVNAFPIAERNDGNTVNAGWLLGGDAASGMEFLVEFSTTNLVAKIAYPTSSQYFNLLVVYDGGSTASNVKFYVNGVLQSHASDTNGSGTRGSDASNTLYIGRADFHQSGCLNGGLSTLAIWNQRQLTQLDALKLQGNPWCYLQPKSPDRWWINPANFNPFIVAGAGDISVTVPVPGARFQDDGHTDILIAGISIGTVFEIDGHTTLSFQGKSTNSFVVAGATAISFTGSTGSRFEIDGNLTIVFYAGTGQREACISGSGVLPAIPEPANYVF